MMRDGTRRSIRSEVQSDADLLHAIRRDLRVVYSEVLKKPLPTVIQTLFCRIEVVTILDSEQVGRQVLTDAD